MKLFNNKKQMRFILSTGMAAFGLIIAVLLYLHAAQPGATKLGTLESVTLATPNYPLSGLAFLARDKGFFKDEGLDLRIEINSIGKHSLEAAIEGKASFAMLADIPIMHAAMAGKKIYVLATLGDTPTDISLIARKDRGISKPADLRRKKIGVVPGTVSAYFLDTLMISNNLDNPDVDLVTLAGEQMVNAMLKNEVDAVATWNPYLFKLQETLGSNAVRLDTSSFFKLTWCLAATQEFANGHPELVKKILRALIKAEQYGKSNPLEMRQAVVGQTGMDNRMYDQNIYRFAVRLDQTLLVALEDESRWAIRRKLTETRDIPNYLKYLYLPGLEAVRPDALTIVR